MVWARLSGCDKCVRGRIWVGGRKVGAHVSPTKWWSQFSRWPDHSCHPTLALLRKLYNPGSWSQDSGDICFLLTQALKLNRKMCLAWNWVPLAENRETLGSSECQGWQVLYQSFYLRLWPLWSPGGMAGWVTESPPPSLTFGNLLARVTAVLFPKQARSFQVSQSLLILFPTPGTLSSPPSPLLLGGPTHLSKANSCVTYSVNLSLHAPSCPGMGSPSPRPIELSLLQNKHTHTYTHTRYCCILYIFIFSLFLVPVSYFFHHLHS